MATLRFATTIAVLLCVLSVPRSVAQNIRRDAPALSSNALAGATAPLELYRQLRAFKLGASTVRVENFVLVRDRLKMIFTGDFYFAERADGGVYGAVFLGRGEFRSPAGKCSGGLVHAAAPGFRILE